MQKTLLPTGGSRDLGLSCKDMKKSGYRCNRCFWDGTRCTSKPDSYKKGVGVTNGKGVCNED